MFINVKIEGVTALICNKFYDEAQLGASNGTSSSMVARSKGTPQEQAEKKLYLGLNGKPMIPQPNVLRCIVEGGRFIKIGKTQLTTGAGSVLYGALDIAAAEIPLEHREPWRVDTRAVVIPSTKGRILAHRPMFDDWALSFEVELDTSIISPDVLREVFDHAGKRIGLGDFRPARKGPYGRFSVVQWKRD